MLIAQQIELQGLSLAKRKVLFYQEINKISQNHRQTNLTINRYNFLKSIEQVWNNDSIKGSFRITFSNEEGIDGGGLNKEFYNLVGENLENPENRMFQQVGNDVLFWHKDLLPLPTIEKSLKTLSALMGNSISRKRLIGVEFATCFIKVLYGQVIVFEDLKEILEPNVFDGYKNLARFSDEDLSAIELYFTVQDGQNEVQIKPDGKDCKLTTANLEEYFERLAIYLIKEKYEDYYDIFRQNLILNLPMNILTSFIKPFEFGLFTKGMKNISYQDIMDVTSIKGSNTHSQWFKMFMKDATDEVRIKFIAFSTGASSIPVEPGFTLKITFMSSLSVISLPLAHTCFNSIEVPNYKSYEKLCSKLTTAFLYGSAGYGMG